MIRIAKSNQVPESLIKTCSYDGDDVKKQLFQDQHNKCYLCEREVTTDFHIEHMKSQENYPALRTEWINLLLSCNYCNPKKGSRYDNIQNPLCSNIEEIIEQRIDYSMMEAVFQSDVDSEQVHNTISLLKIIFNGSSKLRKYKESKFFEEIIGILNKFIQKVNLYKQYPSRFAEEAIRDELSIDKELLGFKYWIIKDDAYLSSVFAKDIIWNKIA